jgi:hypothetical protein
MWSTQGPDGRASCLLPLKMMLACFAFEAVLLLLDPICLVVMQLLGGSEEC